MDGGAVGGQDGDVDAHIDDMCKPVNSVSDHADLHQSVFQALSWARETALRVDMFAVNTVGS